MVRILAVLLVAVMVGLVIETYTDTNLGVSDGLVWIAQNGFASGYAIATNITETAVNVMFGN